MSSISEPMEKFRVMARLLGLAEKGMEVGALVRKGAEILGTNRAEVEGLLLVCKEFRFLQKDSSSAVVRTTPAGISFKRYLDSTRLRDDKSPSARGSSAPGARLCVSMPPRWKSLLLDFAGLVDGTIDGERRVVRDAKERLTVCTPFIDPPVLQTTLANVFLERTRFFLITSESKLLDKQWLLAQLRNVLRRRFGSGKIFYYKDESMIAHAKLWLSDHSMFLTSANVKADSATDNFELGIYTKQPEIVRLATALIDRILRMPGVTVVYSWGRDSSDKCEDLDPHTCL